MKWTNTTITLGQLKPWGDNPKTSSKKDARALLKSWDELGQFQTIAIGPGGEVYDGHQRLSALLTAHGADYVVEARQADRPLTDEERRKIALYSRQIGAWDWDKLANWQPAELMEWGGFDAETLKDWKRDVAALDNFLKSEQTEPADAEPQVDRVAELNEKWQVKTGDLWRIGEHRLLCGDSTKREDVERVMGGERARLEFSDPPYELGEIGGGIVGSSKARAEIRAANIDKFNPSILELIAETSVFCCNKSLIPDYVQIAEKAGQAWDLCFYKKENTPPNFGGHLMTDTEYLPVIGKQSPNGGMEKETYSKAYIGGLDENHFVAWQKPVGLISKYLKLFSKENDFVIDRFACTGTTIVACQNLSRKCRAIEISPNYCSVILQRMSDAFPSLEIRRL